MYLECIYGTSSDQTVLAIFLKVTEDCIVSIFGKHGFIKTNCEFDWNGFYSRSYLLGLIYNLY